MKMMLAKLLTAVASVALLNGLSGQASAQTNVNLNGSAIGINSGILGTNYSTGRSWLPTLGANAYATGVAGGLLADTFDWQTMEGVPWPTLGVLRSMRDGNQTPIFIANIRGTGTHSNPYSVGGFTFNNTDVNMLSGLAAKWVRYTNFILPSLYAGTPVSGLPVTDQGILNQINDFGEASNVLPTAGEAAVPTVKYWEIGNEPEIKVGGWKFTNDPFQLPPFNSSNHTSADYVSRYTQISAAMKAVDPTIKVGPAMLDAVTNTAQALLASNATIDFWGYHPYDNLDSVFKANGTPSQIAAMESELRSVRTDQIGKYNAQVQAFTNAGRNPNNVQFMATEWNAMGGGANPNSSPTMYGALGFVDSIFTFANLKMAGANYWGSVSPDPPYWGWTYPLAQAWQKLETSMGNSLVSSIVDDANNRRIYITRDTATGKVYIWGLNFSNSNDTSIALSLAGMDLSGNATLSILNGGPNGTTLWTSNSTAVGDLTVDWRDQNLTNFNADNFNFSIPHASIVMLELQAVPEPSSLALLGAGMAALMVRRRSVLN
ncbi:MAG: PEP-CTERM sorting domain-containing protein [Phycisphaerales bacterium]|nr:PEP-CTERM sorting domain-containing protein [Phycisphaerales bacterium]